MAEDQSSPDFSTSTNSSKTRRLAEDVPDFKHHDRSGPSLLVEDSSILDLPSSATSSFRILECSPPASQHQSDDTESDPSTVPLPDSQSSTPSTSTVFILQRQSESPSQDSQKSSGPSSDRPLSIKVLPEHRIRLPLLDVASRYSQLLRDQAESGPSTGSSIPRSAGTSSRPRSHNVDNQTHTHDSHLSDPEPHEDSPSPLRLSRQGPRRRVSKKKRLHHLRRRSTPPDAPLSTYHQRVQQNQLIVSQLRDIFNAAFEAALAIQLKQIRSQALARELRRDKADGQTVVAVQDDRTWLMVWVDWFWDSVRRVNQWLRGIFWWRGLGRAGVIVAVALVMHVWRVALL